MTMMEEGEGERVWCVPYKAVLNQRAYVCVYVYILDCIGVCGLGGRSNRRCICDTRGPAYTLAGGIKRV